MIFNYSIDCTTKNYYSLCFSLLYTAFFPCPMVVLNHFYFCFLHYLSNSKSLVLSLYSLVLTLSYHIISYFILTYLILFLIPYLLFFSFFSPLFSSFLLSPFPPLPLSSFSPPSSFLRADAEVKYRQRWINGGGEYLCDKAQAASIRRNNGLLSDFRFVIITLSQNI